MTFPSISVRFVVEFNETDEQYYVVDTETNKFLRPTGNSVRDEVVAEAYRLNACYFVEVAKQLHAKVAQRELTDQGFRKWAQVGR